MASERTAQRGGVPAWPALAAVHGTLLLAFVGLGVLWGGAGSPEPSAEGVDQQLAALDLPAAEAALSEQRDDAVRQAALPSIDVVAPFLASLASSSRLLLLEVEQGKSVEDGPLTYIPVTLSLRGDPMDLPVFLGRLLDGPLDVDLNAVVVTASSGPSGTATLSVRFSRPTTVSEAGIQSLLRESTGAAAAAGPVLVTAAELRSWRAYGSRLDAAQDTRAASRRAAFVALTPALATLRTQGGRLAWAAGGPARLD